MRFYRELRIVPRPVGSWQFPFRDRLRGGIPYVLGREHQVGMSSVTNESVFEHRSLGKQVLYVIITFGLYMIYWFHVTHQQLSEGTDAEFNPTMRTIGLFIPIYNLLVLWRTAHDAEAVTDQDGVLLFLLMVVFTPAAWYLIQSGINEIAQR